MRYYRALTEFKDTPVGGIIELSDEDAARLLKNGAVEETSADHLVKRYGASGKIDADLEKSIKQMRETARRVKGQIDELDGKLAALVADRARLFTGNLHKEDAFALVREDIRRKGEEFKNNVIFSMAKWDKPYRDHPYAWGIERQRDVDAGGTLDIAYLGSRDVARPASQGAFYYYFSDLIEAKFLKILDGLTWDDDSMRIGERRSRVDAIEKEMAVLQAQRNTLAKQLSSIATE